jgi:thiosulfate reductase cytochrome b subunit
MSSCSLRRPQQATLSGAFLETSFGWCVAVVFACGYVHRIHALSWDLLTKVKDREQCGVLPRLLRKLRSKRLILLALAAYMTHPHVRTLNHVYLG